MNNVIITHHELTALNGAPNLQKLIYVFALRPYMDYETSIVGIKRGISYQSIAEMPPYVPTNPWCS
jgi:hypothetical protein